MKNTVMPGTRVPRMTAPETNVASVIETVFTITKGLSLSQVRELTGLEASTIQNWVKRGWVSSPKGKRYDEIQVSRILIINTLRDCLKLEQIAQLMGIVNGSVEDRSDDIIPETQLYNHLCALIFRLEQKKMYSEEIIKSLVEDELKDYTGPREDAPEILKKALCIMLLAYASAALKVQAEQGFEEIIG